MIQPYEDVYGHNISVQKYVAICAHKETHKLECWPFKSLQNPEIVCVHVIYNNALYVLNDTIFINNIKKDKTNSISSNGIKIKSAGPLKNPFGYIISDKGDVYILRMSEYSMFPTKINCNFLYCEGNKLLCADGKSIRTYNVKELEVDLISEKKYEYPIVFIKEQDKSFLL